MWLLPRTRFFVLLRVLWPVGRLRLHQKRNQGPPLGVLFDGRSAAYEVSYFIHGNGPACYRKHYRRFPYI